ncbi:hypothetical protein [Alkalibacillus silvisoli]|uniref:CDP-glycerol glycerophosphotransferase family protein n=1 Tax=Alkalibacillus silvisoli TaxID=392823 RepID=A0ABN0ZNT8_9BACI
MDKHLYEQHYWTLYLDFLELFKNVKYKGYSLAYLCHFRSLIRKNDTLQAKLSKPSFSNQLNHPLKTGLEVQKRFNQFVKKHRALEIKPNSDGKVILHDVYNLLRFPSSTLNSQFNPNKTLMLQERSYKKNTKPKNIPIVYFDEFHEEASTDSKSIDKCLNKVKRIINHHQGHPLFNSTFQSTLNAQIKKIIYRIEESHKLFANVKTSCVIVPSTHYPETRTLVLVAAQFGIPTICMQHGIISGEFGYLPKIADIDAIYGSFEKDWYQQKGVQASGLKMIGHPRFDEVGNRKTISQIKFQRKLKLDRHKKTILIGVRSNSQLDEWRKFIKVISQSGQFNLILRDFPNKKSHLLQKEFPFIKSTKGIHLYDAIHHADAVVTYSSTIALESMLNNRPVFILNKSFPGYTGYYDQLGDLVQSDPEKLGELVVEYFSNRVKQKELNDSRQQFIKVAYPNQHILSGERLSELISRIS